MREEEFQGVLTVVSLVVVESNHLHEQAAKKEDLSALCVVSLVVVESNHLPCVFAFLLYGGVVSLVVVESNHLRLEGWKPS